MAPVVRPAALALGMAQVRVVAHEACLEAQEGEHIDREEESDQEQEHAMAGERIG